MLQTNQKQNNKMPPKKDTKKEAEAAVSHKQGKAKETKKKETKKAADTEKKADWEILILKQNNVNKHHSFHFPSSIFFYCFSHLWKCVNRRLNIKLCILYWNKPWQIDDDNKANK